MKFNYNKLYMMKPMFLYWFLFINLFNSFSQKNLSYEQYIEKYKSVAIREMKRCGIPASITLAQASLESGNGNSRLAVEGNNHFGIKCHDWTGKKIYEDDDKKHECFRKYKNADESFKDHSDFLTTNSRYAFLFELKTSNYKAWSKGLKKAGYATSPTYTQDLIRIIENYKLYKYDKGHEYESAKNIESNHVSKNIDLANEENFTISVGSRKIYQNNRVDYIIAEDGETFEELSEELELISWELPRYNGLSRNTILKKGQIVYIQPKRNKAELGKTEHIVSKGETMWDISQKYAVKLKKMYSINLLEPGTELEVGEKLLLRKKKK